MGMGLFGGGESAGPTGSGGVPPETSSATAVSGGTFKPGSVSFGGGLDTKTILIIGAVALAAVFLLKR